ncbi:HEAT repeat domain-containing protein [Spongiimicrobium salis]|uniref:HEAT repeat domain-containing protein n=1 Tax=Spongiimicrobium salis TaxID=1667022 RepID=UPI00374D0FDF
MKEQAEFNYNEPKWKAPAHKYPKGEDFDRYKHPGIGARIIIEQALQSMEGVNLDNLERLGIAQKDLTAYRKQIKDALLALLKEGDKTDVRLRSGAISYLGALSFFGTADVITEIALNPNERPEVRGHATESLIRLMGRKAALTIEKLMDDPLPIIREKAIRGIGNMRIRESIPLLRKIVESDPDVEVRYRASAALEQIETGKLPKRPRKKGKAQTTMAIENIVKPLGRHTGVPPQTTPNSVKGVELSTFGGEDVVANQILAEMATETEVYPLSYEVLPNHASKKLRLKLRGRAIGNSICEKPHIEVYRIHENELVLEYDEGYHPKLGRKLNLSLKCDQRKYQDVYWIPETTTSPVILELSAKDRIIWAKNKFGVRIKFHIPQAVEGACLRLKTRFPKANWEERYFTLTKEDIVKGEKYIEGFVAATTGAIEMQAQLYTTSGNTSKYKTTLDALPPNPISMTVTPSTSGTIGEGPAHFNGAENRFYCYATLRITNGFEHSVTVGPLVWARVTDGGTEKDNFSFTISTVTIPANSTRNIGIYMSFGGNTYNVFKNYGDVTIRLTVQTSEGDVIDSHVWAAMAQVKLALNYVGNFSGTTKNRFQSVVDNEASAIYEQQNLYISESANFDLPSTHADFHRFRDIEMDDNKDSDCTAGSDEADDLRDDWSSPNDPWLDVWIVESLSGPPCAASVGGFSPVNGPTGKGGSRSGVIINMAGIDLSTGSGRSLMGIIVAHEVGHFLGLNHTGPNSNFMAATTGGSNTDITHGQYMDMTNHGFVTRFVV